ncbi:unnamed protein product (macronuclear) [Paramecium tetraurelia]|uniref:RBR-type E3 ubiquitin transferase n=1 Tax=Paramecium tetraurelia TaxID=5888 RepID=A0BW72_PARTE|nr:uncharacterized protein GSPATT00032641001 [Paramecium tetraurelia]CAK62789.1 unnamed protein product [Paramecium tetraurelia]|eukprot:XP_001430187.1 hypothetical protein (macronuclear) [Paramecium tetraurelia strain d4-2]
MGNVKLTRCKSEQQLQNQKIMTNNAEKVFRNLKPRDHFVIQMSKSDELGETIKYHTHLEETQNKQAIKDRLIENFNKKLDLAKIFQLQISDVQGGLKTQEAVNNDDVYIQIESPPVVGAQENDKRQVTLIDFEKNSNEDNNNEGQKLSVAILVAPSELSSEQNIDYNNQSEEIQIQSFDQENTCPICSSSFEKIVRLLECEHKFCTSCYKEYLENKIKIAKINNVTCLQEGCTTIFSEDIIEQLVNEQKFQQYLVFKRKYEIENDPTKKWCPAQGCDRFIEKDPRTKIVQCQCGSLVCFNCGQLAHQGMLCEDAIQGDFKQALVKYLIKYCPKCKSHIQKNAGCNHMTCNCSFQFCWACLQPYHQYHYRYWSLKGCAIWSDGRFKTQKEISNPDKMRKIYFAPRLVLYILRGPLLIVKLIMQAAGKSIAKPFCAMNKRLCRSLKTKFWY